MAAGVPAASASVSAAVNVSPAPQVFASGDGAREGAVRRGAVVGQQQGPVAVEGDHDRRRPGPLPQLGARGLRGRDPVGPAELTAQQERRLPGVGGDDVGARRGPARRVVGVDDQPAGALARGVEQRPDQRHRLVVEDPAAVVADDHRVGALDRRAQGVVHGRAPVGVQRFPRRRVEPRDQGLVGEHPPLGRGGPRGIGDDARGADAEPGEHLAHRRPVGVVAEHRHELGAGAERREVGGRVRRGAGRAVGVVDLDDRDRRLARQAARRSGEPLVEHRVAHDDHARGDRGETGGQVGGQRGGGQLGCVGPRAATRVADNSGAAINGPPVRGNTAGCGRG